MNASRACLLIGLAGLLLLGLGAASRFSPWSGPSRTGSCEGCHAMAPQSASWRSGSHAQAAGCSDCHLPPGASIRRAQSTAADGLRHAAMTTLGTTPPVIRLGGAGAQVVQENCLRCHPRAQPGAPPVDASRAPRPLLQPATAAHADPGRACADCHRETSHARKPAR